MYKNKARKICNLISNLGVVANLKIDLLADGSRLAYGRFAGLIDLIICRGCVA